MAKVIIFVFLLQLSAGFFWTISQMLKVRRSQWMSAVPTNPYKMGVSNCSYISVNGFLKMKCLIENREYFKCINSNRFYRVILEDSNCWKTKFSRVCPNDTTFYQACGHVMDGCKKLDKVEHKSGLQDSVFGPDVAACGELICRRHPGFIDTSKYSENSNPHYIKFLNQNLLNRTGSTISSKGFECTDYFACTNSINGVPVAQFACERWAGEGQETKVGRNCDNVCNNFDCFDEAFCNNLTVGMLCLQGGRRIYVTANQICDSYSNCEGSIDEIGCENFSETCMTQNIWLTLRANSEGKGMGAVQRHLHTRSKCSLPQTDKDATYIVCLDFRDQMNCTGSTISPLVCNVNGYPTTISQHVICRKLGSYRADKGLCDDGVDQQCVEAETGCKIHKHQICDGTKDCLKGHDEGDLFCKEMFDFPTIECVRRFSQNATKEKLPNGWVLDGVTDCRSGQDENPKFWTKLCGSGLFDVYVPVKVDKGASNCSEVIQLKCPGGRHRLNLSEVCLGKTMDNCDAEVCVTARKEYLAKLFDRLEVGISELEAKRTIYCLPGLREIELYAGKCSVEKFLKRPSVMGIRDVSALSPRMFAWNFIECGQIFGELYVYLACTGLCRESISSCPLNSDIATWTCSNYPARKTVFSLADTGKIVLATRNRDSYSQEVFSCDNGVCTTFDKVCNLANDCGDLSDERGCLNNFKCNESGELIPLTSKCDGRFDCFDYSDECNEECDNQVTMFGHVAYNIIAWIFGICATLLNIFTLFNGIYEYKKLKTETAKVNKVFVFLITVGDLLQGIFLLVLSIGEQFFNKSTCNTQFEWTTSTLCTFLGVFSTIGSLVSLYSMTVLSVIRACKVHSMKRPKETLSREKAMHLLVVVLIIIVIATVIALVPIVSFEDYFVENLMYEDNPLFVGAPNKIKHLQIVESYYGRVYGGTLSEKYMSWAKIRNLVRDLFVNDNISGKSLDFYGSNGFCLFSYFVRDQTSFRWFSISILILNFICVLVIVICYAIITAVSVRSSKSVSKNEETVKNNKKLQRKITIIIVTDILTWLPFILLCAINYTELIDTSSWYSLFCVFFLRINSIINPIGIYDETIFRWIKNVGVKIREKIARLKTMENEECPNIQELDKLPQQEAE